MQNILPPCNPPPAERDDRASAFQGPAYDSTSAVLEEEPTTYIAQSG